MSQDQMSSVIKCGTNTCYSNTFVWNINSDNNARSFTSNIFQFCGYNCYLKYSRILVPFSNKEELNITLLGYQALYKKNIFCHYSLIFKNDGLASPSTKTGEINSTEESIRVNLYQRIISGYSTSESICFSWCENGDSYKSSKGVQTDPDISTNVLERGIQTEEIQLSLMKSTRSETENENYRFLEILSNELGSFYEGQTNPDCLLKVGETKFPVHRSLLAARCPVFAAMFHHDTLESRNGEVDIPDVDAAILNEVLYYIYSGKIRGLSSDTASAMYEVADKYSLIELRDKCLEFLLHNLTIGNVCDAAVLSHTHAEEKLEKEVIKFIKLRLEELTESEKWKRFSTDHFLIANRLLCSALIASQKGKI